MDRLERVRQLREQYEGALDDAERHRAEYHREVVKLHRSGMSLREIAEALGMSHQRVHQIVGGVEERPHRRGRVAGLTAGLVIFAFAATSIGVVLSRHPESPVAALTHATPTPIAALTHATPTPIAVATSPRHLPHACRVVALVNPRTGEVLAVSSSGRRSGNCGSSAFRPFVDAALLESLITG